MNIIENIPFLPRWVDQVGENYDNETIKRIRKDPVSWLNSLPLVEYAHTLVVLTAHTLGGEPRQYVNILYNLLMQPVIMRYYRELEKYRFERALTMRKWPTTMKIMPAESHIILRGKMRKCTAKVKGILRQICDDYAFIKSFPIHHIKVQMLSTEIKRMSMMMDPIDWSDHLKKFVEVVNTNDFENKIVLLDEDDVDKSDVVYKVNELASMFGVDILDGNPNFSNIRDKVSEIIGLMNVKQMNGTTSYKYLACVINKVIKQINNQKTRQLAD